MNIPNNEQKTPIPNIQTIELSDTLSKFVEKCNENFSAIAAKGGGPAGASGEKGDPGMPTKPKVPIHVWKKYVDYKEETKDFQINNINVDLSNSKYQEGHLILLENGHVYILDIQNNGTSLTPKYLLTLQYKINTLQSGSLNLLDRTEFEIYTPINNDDTETELITKSDPITKNFTLHDRNSKNINFKIIDKFSYDNQIYTNSFKIDATDFKEKVDNNKGNSHYFDITQQLNVKKDNINYTILKPLTTYTLHCKYKCKRDIENTPYSIPNGDETKKISTRGGLHITCSNPIWKNINGDTVIDDINNTSNTDIETVFAEDKNDWTPITIKFTTNDKVGWKYDKNSKKYTAFEGCTLYVRAYSGCIVEICELKLEEGDIHTSWTPSLADITPKSSLIYDKSNSHDLYIKKYNYTNNTLIIVPQGVNASKDIFLPSTKEISNGYVVKIKYLPQYNTYTVKTTDDSRIIGIDNRASDISITVEKSYSEFTYFGENIWCQTK